MTTEIRPEAPEEEPVPAPRYVPASDGASRDHLVVASGFLIVALLLGLVAAIQQLAPEFLGGVAILSYGRVQPAAIHLFSSGWLTIGLIGAFYYVVPRRVGVELASQSQARIALALLTVGTALGGIGILSGLSEGRRFVEAPLWADLIVLVGLIGVARIVIATIRRETELGPVSWFVAAATWWLVLIHIAGNIPGLSGVSSAIQSAFYASGFTGLFLAAGGVGLVYYLIPRLTGSDAVAGTQMTIVGLWSLGIVWSLTASSALTYGPTPDWLDTVGVVFALAMFVPVAVIFADILTAMRGRWGTVTDKAVLRFVMAGAVAFALLPLLNLAQSLRASSAVIGATEWLTATHFLATGVMATFWLIAYASLAGPDLGRHRPRFPMAHYRTTLVGAGLVVGASLFGGIQAGLTWIGAANSEPLSSVGDGFRNTLEPLTGVLTVRLVGLVVYTLTLIWFAAAALSPSRERADIAAEPEGVPVADTPELDPDVELRTPLGLGRLRRTALAFFAVVALLALVLPSLEEDQSDPTLLADTYRDYDDGDAAAGRQVYLREGCQFCHTQAVRPIVTDVGLGPVSQPGDYAHETPAVLGAVRVGPDLMHVAGRSIEMAALDLAGPDGDPNDPVIQAAARDQVVTFLSSHLRDPRQARPWSNMPSYDYLTDSDVDALVAYVASLN